MIRLLVVIVLFLVGLGFAMMPRDGRQPQPVVQDARVLTVQHENASDYTVPAGNGLAKVAIPRSDDGHFYVDAQVGAATIHFLIDTGASAVALTRADAQRAGLFPAAGEFTDEARTANGTVALKPVVIDRIRIGPLEARNVEAAVIEGDLEVSLLGQSWLKHVGQVTIKGDQLTLN